MVHSMFNNYLHHYSTVTAVSEVTIRISERKQQHINKSISLSRSCTFKGAQLLSWGGKEERELYAAWGHKTPQCKEEDDAMSGCWMRTGTASVFSAASILNSLAYLRLCWETVKACRGRRLALVMRFDRKCGVTTKTGTGRRADGRLGGERAQKELGWPLDADKPPLISDLAASSRLQYNRINMAHPSGVQRQIKLARSEWMSAPSGT